MPAAGEKLLAAELMVVLGVETMDALSGANTGTFSLPNPSQYFATLVVFLVLSGVAAFGEKPARLASAFGGLAALTILMAPTKASKAAGHPEPLILSAFDYLTQIINGGTLGQQDTSSGTLPNIGLGGVGAAVAGGAASLGGSTGGSNPTGGSNSGPSAS